MAPRKYPKAIDDTKGQLTKKNPKAIDDTEGQIKSRNPKAVDDTKTQAARKAPKAVDDTEGHRSRTAKAVDDTEGHGLLLDPTTTRDMARIRDREVQRRTERHGQEEEARRPHKAKAK